MIRVSSVDLQRNLSRYREIAVDEPVIVTSYNKDQIVMVSADLFNKLKDNIGAGGSEPYDGDRYARAHSAHMALREKRQAYARLSREEFDFLEAMFTANVLIEGPETRLLEVGGYVINLTRGRPSVVCLSPFIDTFSDGCIKRFAAIIRPSFGGRDLPHPYVDLPDQENVQAAGFVHALLGLAGDPDDVADWMTQQVLAAYPEIERKDEFKEKIKNASEVILKENAEVLRIALNGHSPRQLQEFLGN